MPEGARPRNDELAALLGVERSMQADEAESKFREADQSYRDGRFKAALSALEELDAAFPNDRHILYPKARCLVKLNREEEAIALCEAIIEKHGYSKARELKNRLVHGAPALPENKGFDVGDFTFQSLNIEVEESPASSAFNKPPATRASSSGTWSLVLKIAIAAIIFGIAAVLLYLRF